MRSCIGQSGHGVSGERSSGGLGMISNWCTDSGFWRWHGAQAVGAGVAAADDDHAFAGGENFDGGIQRVAVAALVLLRQKFHGVVNSLQLAAWNFQVARMLRSAGQHDGIEIAAQIFDGIFCPLRRWSRTSRLRRTSARGGGR